MNEVRESQFADRAARTVVTIAGVALVLAGGWEVTQKVIQVPNVAAALKIAAKMPKDSAVVTVQPDRGDKYLSVFAR